MLFRSLNMANKALAMPAGSDATFYDTGRMIALWVSAFEILVHPENGESGYKQVYKILEKVEWQCESLIDQKFKAYTKSIKARPCRNFSCWLYGEIYHARNKFLHGNPVAPDDLILKSARHNLFEYAALLYRMALTGFLEELQWHNQLPSMDDTEAFAEASSDQYGFYHNQEKIEEALLTASGEQA